MTMATLPVRVQSVLATSPPFQPFQPFQPAPATLAALTSKLEQQKFGVT